MHWAWAISAAVTLAVIGGLPWGERAAESQPAARVLGGLVTMA